VREKVDCDKKFDNNFHLQDVILKTIDEYIRGKYGKILERNT
jgi:TolB-like protein